MSTEGNTIIYQKISVGDICLSVAKIGTGSHPVLCLPGALGSSETDFGPQFEYMNHDKFTLVVCDPQGWGKSRPPNRIIIRNSRRRSLEKDGENAHRIMKELGYEKYSILGWSSGAGTGILLASKYPGAVRRMVIWGGQAFISEKNMQAYKKFTNVDDWSEDLKRPMINMYGEDYFRKAWISWVNSNIELYYAGGNACVDKLEIIKCPTFIIHGAKDALVGIEHAQFIHENIKDSKLTIMPEGKHDLHLRFFEEFNTLAEGFLLEDE